MTENEDLRKKIAMRQEITALYRKSEKGVVMFARLFNAGEISRRLLDGYGFIEAEDLERWDETYEDKAESDAALIESLNRFIETLESRDKERINRINNLEEQCREHVKTIRELKERLSGILTDKQE